MMLVMLISFLVAAFALLCIRVPSVWYALMAIDEPSDSRELGLVVASRNPFRESGPPACMAKLIMMRHKVRSPRSFLLRPFARSATITIYSRPFLVFQLNQANTRRRRTTVAVQRSVPRQFTLPTPRQRAAPWIRVSKHFSLQHH
ncbi:hypothetical protein BC826DRAFT_914419 [Russula brevipes]|nr:hypothetical protein BC826DRAFT_914419 [Russula brevipes]